MSYSFSYKQEEYDELTKLVHLGIWTKSSILFKKSVKIYYNIVLCLVPCIGIEQLVQLPVTNLPRFNTLLSESIEIPG